MSRYFNTTGPCNPDRHYMLPAERRLPDLDLFVVRELYFVLHAARQTGKTTTIRAFAERLRTCGTVALHVTLETSQGICETVEAERYWIAAVAEAARISLAPEERPPDMKSFLDGEVGSRFRQYLTAWAESIGRRPLVLLLDEADVVSGPAMVSLLRQLRAGFHERPAHFPASVALVGMRDLRDYLAEAKDGLRTNPGSPFNIKAASLTLRNFTRDELAELYLQHTQETGQPFTPEAVDRAFWWTGGQPFLVNALADIAVTHLVPDRTVPIGPEVMDRAKERLITARTTHLDALGQRLREPRVARVMASLLLGDDPSAIDYQSDDFLYVQDLGLVGEGSQGAQAANPLYREILARELSYNIQQSLPAPEWPWRRPDGKLDFPSLIREFLSWWRENADMLRDRHDGPYKETAAHLAFMGFLQRIVNGGGDVHREFAAARGRVDIVVSFGGERFAIELKRIHPRYPKPARVEAEGIRQLGAYLSALGLSDGWLLVFDPRPEVDWESKFWEKEIEVDGRVLHVRGA